MPIRCFLDEDMPLDLVTLLLTLGWDAIHAIPAKRRGFPDYQHLADAVRDDRMLITCNKRDLTELNGAWITWAASVTGGTGLPPQSGIVLMPSGNKRLAPAMAAALTEFANRNISQTSRLFQMNEQTHQIEERILRDRSR